MYRVFDILFSTIAILLLSPILIVVSIILKFTNDDKIFYTQERVGLGGKIFHVYKFTTMVKNSETMGSGTITLKNDSRVFPFGKFLRRTKVNELPQLFNILNGDMSIVGPRPLPMERYSNYSDEIKYNINKVLPGLSGVGSVLFRNEDEILNQVDASDKVEFYDKIIAPYKGAVEIWYVQNLSLYVYFTVIFMTAFVVVFPNRKVNYSKFFKGFPTPPEELKALL
ncbi:MAG: sugar transferase [Epsilonproteobacteria bacterium]|nr:sugar transferase [Campylobacterota bacterium]